MRRSIIGVITVVFVTILVAGCVTGQYYRPGKGFIETQSVRDHCRIASKSGGASGGYNAQSSLIGAVLVGASGGLMQSISTGSKTDDCMTQNGYVKVPLSDEELREIETLKTDDEKLAYLDKVYRAKVRTGEIVQIKDISIGTPGMEPPNKSGR